MSGSIHSKMSVVLTSLSSSQKIRGQKPPGTGNVCAHTPCIIAQYLLTYEPIQGPSFLATQEAHYIPHWRLSWWADDTRQSRKQRLRLTLYGWVDLILGPVLSAMETSATESGIAFVGRLESDKWKVGDVPMPAIAGSGPGRTMASLSSNTLLLKVWPPWLPCLCPSFTTMNIPYWTVKLFPYYLLFLG